MKSHFTFTKQQRNGIFLLILIIIVLQTVYFLVNFNSKTVFVNNEKILTFQKEIDSLKLVSRKKLNPKIFPFNPNYITDFKGANLGMTNEEIDRLLAYRKQNKWVNSPEEFQQITKISDSLLNKISPYFKFPEWVVKQKTLNKKGIINTEKTFAEKQDLNLATAEDLQKVRGIGEYYSKRIIKLRNLFPGGFIADVQLQDVYGLTPEVIKNIKQAFTVKTPRLIKKLNINTVSIDSLVTVQHIDYDLAHRIIEQRQLREGYKTIEELTKVNGFPVNKIEIIKLYLFIEK